MKPRPPFARALSWGLAWGVWTAVPLMLVFWARRDGWFQRSLGLAADPHWTQDDDGLKRLEALLHMPIAWMPAAWLMASVASGCLVFAAAAALDPQGLALRSWRWSFRSPRAALTAMATLTLASLSILVFASGWQRGAVTVAMVVLGAVVPMLLDWLVLHRGVATPDRAGPLWPFRRATRRVAGLWLCLVLLYWLVVSKLEHLFLPLGLALGAITRAWVVHCLVNRDRDVSFGPLARQTLRPSVSGPWLVLAGIPWLAMSALIGPVAATAFFNLFEAHALRAAADHHGLDLPGWIQAWIFLGRWSADHWWMAMPAAAVAAYGWSVFADARLAHAQRAEVHPVHGERQTFPVHPLDNLASPSTPQEPA